MQNKSQPNRSEFPPIFTRSILITCVTAVVLIALIVKAPILHAQSIYPAATPVETTNEPVLQKDQIREVLIELLQNDSKQKKDTIESEDPYGKAFSSFVSEQTRSEAFRQEINLFFNKVGDVTDTIPEIPDQIKAVYVRITSSLGSLPGLKLIALIALILVFWFATQILLGRRLRNYPSGLHTSQTDGITNRLKHALIMVFLEFEVILTYVALSAFIPFFLVAKDSSAQIMLFSFWTTTIEFSFWLLLLKFLFSPKSENIRLMAVPDKEARSDYRLLSAFFFIFTFGFSFVQIMVEFGFNQSLAFWMFILSLLLNSLLVTRQWLRRNSSSMLFTESAAKNNIGLAIVNLWPLLFTLWLGAVWVIWLYNIIMAHEQGAFYAAISWWITLFFPFIDRSVYLLLQAMTNMVKLESQGFKQRSMRFVNTLLYSSRLLLVGIALYTLIRALGFSMSAFTGLQVEGSILGTITDVTFVLIISYIVWELLHTYLESKIPEDDDGMAHLGNDGGGAGATRADTLLPLVRSFLSTVLIIFITLAVLHAMGVRVAPLLAGAGIIGIAIGFGAQKLVQDILSGIFFLIDDAFRKGEYIEIETLRGTVEKISIRSMQLRHHLGAVQTIPYGEIKTIRNLSRDWVTMKLEIRLPYQTDIEQVRKIIKKTGQKMLEDPELGPNFILPLKSQGVSRVEESALMVRMKFTARPGEQWVIRREAYRRVKDALSEKGIEFAHREVFVRLPAEVEQQLVKQNNQELSPSTKQLLPQIAAAAIAGLDNNDNAEKSNNDAKDKLD